MNLRNRLAAEPILLMYGLCMLVYLLAISWSQPIMDSVHSFRQTQTAISAYWLARGDGSLLDYQTPVLGYPWSIPFEFPLYQWLVAKFSGVGDVTDIDHAGRIVNVLFFLGSAWLVYLVAKRVSDDKKLAALCAAALLISPLMLFWSRAVMIESTALFFSLGFVLSLSHLVERPSLRWVVIGLIAAVLAALVKITTFFGFGLFAGCALLVHVAKTGMASKTKQHLILAALSGAIVLVSLLVIKLWLVQADQLKAQTIWGINITSAYMGHWNYGTMEQRLDPKFWTEVVFQRSLSDAFGTPWIMLVAALVALTNKRAWKAGVLLLIGYLAPFVVFTNLHQVHDYYPYANIVFATTLMGLAIWVISEHYRFGRYAATLAAVAVCVFSWLHICAHYKPLIDQDVGGTREMQVATYLKQHSGRGEVLLLFGMDWASTVPYYAERKALMMPGWVPVDEFKMVFNANKAFGQATVGGVVLCPNADGGDPARAEVILQLVEHYRRGFTKSVISECDVYTRGGG